MAWSITERWNVMLAVPVLKVWRGTGKKLATAASQRVKSVNKRGVIALMDGWAHAELAGRLQQEDGVAHPYRKNMRKAVVGLRAHHRVALVPTAHRVSHGRAAHARRLSHYYPRRKG